MSFDPEFLTLMPHSITVAPPTGTKDKWGNPEFGTAATYQCYIDPAGGEEIVRTTAGDDRKATYRIYVATTTVINPEGELTLPSGFDPRKPKILASSLVSDEEGPHHVVIVV